MSQQTPQTAPEEMASFFDVRADGYEDHMRSTEIYDGENDEFYSIMVSPIAKTSVPVRILDLGCGTGFELTYIFRHVPHARITCIDLSIKMLELLQQKYSQYAEQLEIVRDSYVTQSFAQNQYDYVVSAITMHHLLEDAKLDLYRKIRNTLKDGSVYIEADYVVDEAEEKRLMNKYREKIRLVEPEQLYHIDIPFTVPHQEQLFSKAGFRDVKTIHHAGNGAIFVARK